MYLALLKIQNFRILRQVEIPLQKGLNVLLGENDSGKTAIIDAIRLLLGTRDFERIQIASDDFYIDQNGRVRDLCIEGLFRGLSDEEAALFLEWVSIESTNQDGSLNYILQIRLSASRRDLIEIVNKYEREIRSILSAGPDTAGSQLTQEARDLLRVTYLKPLRDAEQEMAARRGSRLSQILLAHPAIRQQDPRAEDSIPGIMRQANTQVTNHPAISEPLETLNQDYLSNFTLGTTAIQASVGISDPSLRAILEHLELTLTDNIPNVETRHGLGLNNLLFMAAELLLLQSTDSPAPLVIIEEPEAHLHPQFQLRLMHFLEQQTGQVQVIMTSHSPNLASKAPLKNVLLVRRGQVYPLGQQYTKLEETDYRFLQNFLDVTKANLFFARGVLVVEGEAEQILLPVIASLIGRPLEQYGVSIVNVGHVGLFRYARIFQRSDDSTMGVPVACITDLDIPSYEAVGYLHKDKRGNPPKTHADLKQNEIDDRRKRKIERASGGCVSTFVSPVWTLEHDLCYHNADLAILIHQAILLGKASDKLSHSPTEQQVIAIRTIAQNEIATWHATGSSQAQISALIYKPLYLERASKVITAHYLARLLEENYGLQDQNLNRPLFPKYLIDAIEHVSIQSSEGTEECF